MKRQKVTATVGLIPHRISRWKLNRARIAKPPDASQRSKVMIKGTIFLHQDDDVFDVGDVTVAVICGDLKRSTDACRKSSGARGQKLEKSAAVSIHGTKA
jgi:hypothetical protein